MDKQWPIQLFKKSVLKQQKYRQLTALLGPTEGLHCLDIGSDNGVISYLFRQQGGTWKSADLDAPAIEAIRSLVETDVYPLNGQPTPFNDDEFDRVVIVDFLEHIPDDRAFVEELHRIMKPDSTLIINVPHIKNSLLRRFRLAIGQTDEKHGHLRPGYTIDTIRTLLGEHFRVEQHHTYSKFFSEFIDTMVVGGVSLVKRGQHSQKGAIVTGQDLNANAKMFQMYALIYPFMWLVSKLDRLLFFRSGYMLLVKARANKR